MHRKESNVAGSEQVEAMEEPIDDLVLPKGYWYSWRFIGSVLAIVLLGNNLFIGYLMPSNVLGVIDADLGPDPNIYLVNLINTLIKGCFILLVGSISDVMGRRWFIVCGQVLGFIGACVAASAKTINILIVAQIFVGLGGATALLFPLLLHEIVPNKHRGLAHGSIMAMTLPTLGLGPAFARMMVEYTELRWRWIYWLNAIATGLSVILFIVCYHPPGYEQLTRTGRKNKMQAIKELDWIGLVLYIAGLVGLLLALTWGGRQYAWTSAPVIVCMVLGIVILIGFGFYEVYAPLKIPLFPVELFKIRDFTVAVIVGSIGQMAYYAANVIWPQHVSRLYTTDNLTIGWMSCTTGASMIVGEVLTGPFLKKGYRIKLQMMISMAGLTLFCGLMALSDEYHMSLAIGFTIAVGLFVGWIELVCQVVAGVVIPPAHIGSGQAFFASVRATSGTIVTSIYIAVQTNEFSAQLPTKVTQAVQDSGLPSERIAEIIAAVKGAKAITTVQGVTGSAATVIADAVRSAYASSYKMVYLSSLAWCGLALICCFFATSRIEEQFTGFLNKTVDSEHIEASQHAKVDVEKVAAVHDDDELTVKA